MTLIPNINSYRFLITIDFVRIISITTESFDPGRPFFPTDILYSVNNKYVSNILKKIGSFYQQDGFALEYACITSVSLQRKSLTLLYFYFIQIVSPHQGKFCLTIVYFKQSKFHTACLCHDCTTLRMICLAHPRLMQLKVTWPDATSQNQCNSLFLTGRGEQDA